MQRVQIISTLKPNIEFFKRKRVTINYQRILLFTSHRDDYDACDSATKLTLDMSVTPAIPVVSDNCDASGLCDAVTYFSDNSEDITQ